jgi:hypothetical protein
LPAPGNGPTVLPAPRSAPRSAPASSTPQH